MASVYLELPLRSVGSLSAPGIASEATLSSVLAELQLKADLTETQPVSFGGKAIANTPVRRDYSSSGVTTAAYVELVAALSNATSEIEIFDSSGQTMVLAVGAAASEVNQVYIIPGGNGPIPLLIAAGARVSIKAISANASAGEITINFYR